MEPAPNNRPLPDSPYRAAARWWADHLRRGAPLDNGDTSDMGAIAMMLGKMGQNTNPGDKIDAFEDALTESLTARGPQYNTIGCDYGPDHIISGAAARTGIVLGMSDLPWKSHTTINDGAVEAKCGHGAESTTIYTLPAQGSDQRRIPTLPIGHKGDQDRGPYYTELGVGAWFVVDSTGAQVGNSYDDEALAQATADALNGMEPDAETVEVSK